MRTLKELLDTGVEPSEMEPEELQVYIEYREEMAAMQARVEAENRRTLNAVEQMANDAKNRADAMQSAFDRYLNSGKLA